MTKRYQVSTSISVYTWYQIHRLATEYGTQREVITRAVELLDKEYWKREYKGYWHPDPHSDIQAKDGYTSHALGAELWARAGDLSIREAKDSYGGLTEAARAAAGILHDVKVYSDDGQELDKESLIYIYLTGASLPAPP